MGLEKFKNRPREVSTRCRTQRLTSSYQNEIVSNDSLLFFIYLDVAINKCLCQNNVSCSCANSSEIDKAWFATTVNFVTRVCPVRDGTEIYI